MSGLTTWADLGQLVAGANDSWSVVNSTLGGAASVYPDAGSGSGSGSVTTPSGVDGPVHVTPGFPQDYRNWWALLALALVAATAGGNILVCLAIWWERRLQNMTNYFLMSLAITDLMVAVLVMPVGILTLVRVCGQIRCVYSVANLPSAGPRFIRYVASADNASCSEGPSTINTTDRLTKLRQLMVEKDLHAYIITGSDAHGSEYTADHDNRREWISGLTGSAGDAVVTLKSAALWTDSRYYLQAQRQLDCNWQLMKRDEPEVPPIQKWISEQLENNTNVGADPSILTYEEWTSLDKYLGPRGKAMKSIEINLVDVIWGSEQPTYPNDSIEILPDNYTGEPWTSKVRRLQNATAELSGDFVVLNALDDAAWLFNMRSSEVEYTPVFRAYVVVPTEKSELPVSLYLPENKITESVQNHLMDEKIHVRVLPYDQIWLDLPKMAEKVQKVILPEPGYLVRGSSYRLYKSIPTNKVKWAESPMVALRSRKNPVEVTGMQASHVRDSVALCQLMATLETEIPLGACWDEMSVARRLTQLRAAQELSKGDSFQAIVAFGTHSALPHYAPTEETNVQITNDNILMIDSGGQYADGTTDVTRTIHLGTPTEFQINVYTRLLQGCANLASLNFPSGKTFRDIDVILRQPLYQLGLDYGHGSSHGIGAYLSVHEAFESVYHKNVFVSHEPGFYKDGKFGMRLENIVQVVKAKAQYDTAGKFLTFDTTTLVPYERKLINATLMTDAQIQWVNQYYHKIRKDVGEEMLRQGLNDTYIWLLKQTEPIK